MVTKHEITTYESICIFKQQIFTRMHSALTDALWPSVLPDSQEVLPAAALFLRCFLGQDQLRKGSQVLKEPHRREGTGCRHPKTQLNGSTVGDHAVHRQSHPRHPSRGTSSEHGGFGNEDFSFSGP